MIAEPIVVNAALVGMGLMHVATFRMAWMLRDEVRDMHRTLSDPRTGLTKQVDEHETRLGEHEERLNHLARPV